MIRCWLNAIPLLLGGGVSAQLVDMRQTGLVGKLEAPEIVTYIPRQFHEAPALAALVKEDKLPPVEQRLPAEPLVLKPLRAVGTYGGTWRRAFLGPGMAKTATASVPETNRCSGT